RSLARGPCPGLRSRPAGSAPLVRRAAPPNGRSRPLSSHYDGSVERIGPYRIVRKLGQGGMAQVLQAVAFGASGFAKQVAIQLLLPELEHSADLVRALIEEARLGSRLVHRNLVQVHQLGVAEGRYYVVMDFVDGSDLDTLVRRRRPTAALALHIV